MFAVAAFDALTANIAILDPSGRIIAVNRAWERFAQTHASPVQASPVQASSVQANPIQGGRGQGQQPSGLGHNYLAICEATQGEDRPYALSIAADIRAVLAGQSEGETEYTCMLPDGLHHYLARVSGFAQDTFHEATVSLHEAAPPHETGVPGELRRYAVVAHEDITRRKLAELEVSALNRQLEARVLQRSLELEERNAELLRVGAELTQRNEALIESNLLLARFAHVASHDLQEPLRIVGAYSDMLRHRYHDVLDSRGQGYLDHITDQVTRARQMVKGVLAFSGVSQPLAAQALPLATLWQDAVRFLDWPPDAHLSCGQLPVVMVNPAQMRQLLGNLLGNSLKFRTQDPLEVSMNMVAQADGFAELVLRDNGVGIEAEYRQQVFGMFQRLHSRSAYADQGGGNGIGLAICQKIIEQHGGAIWVGESDQSTVTQGAVTQSTVTQSTVTHGTAIHFTLPLA